SASPAAGSSTIVTIALHSLACPTATPVTTAAGVECGRHMDCGGSTSAATTAITSAAHAQRDRCDAAVILIRRIAGTTSDALPSSTGYHRVGAVREQGTDIAVAVTGASMAGRNPD